jgi:hypothetical protein
MYCLWLQPANTRMAGLSMGWPRGGAPVEGVIGVIGDEITVQRSLG